VDVFAVPIGDEAKSVLIAIGGELRAAGVRFDLAYGDRGLKGAMKAADKSQAPWVLIVGDQEVADGTVVVRDMASGEQETVAWESVQPLLAQRLKKNEGIHS
jgi:histidyl-tRNA synthetase